MRKLTLAVLFLVGLTVLGIPLLVFRGSAAPDPGAAATGGLPVRVWDKNTGRIVVMPLEQYLVGVVAAEMPANFGIEALKAQAVAARTYTLKHMFTFGAKPKDGHPAAEVCTEPTHCQAWISVEEMRNKWSAGQFTANCNKIRMAVNSTAGLVIAYNGAFIEPVYHGSCGGRGTENSADVWSGPELPYLQGADCGPANHVAEQVYTVLVNRSQLASALNRLGRGAPAQALARGKSEITTLLKSNRGRVRELDVFGRHVTGAELRRILGLTSTYLDISRTGEEIIISSYGKGHAVGLCQYGANGMAQKGRTCREILEHYYTGVKLQKI